MNDERYAQLRFTRLPDDRLVQLRQAALDHRVEDLTPDEIQWLCEELLSRRKNDRLDSRRAKQVQKLKWAAELLLTKIDALAKRDADEAAIAEEASP